MRVVPLREAHLPALHEVYVRLTRDVPHCRFQPSLAHFSKSLLRPAKGNTRIGVAEDDAGTAIGFSALLPPAPTGPSADAAVKPPEAELTALFAEDEGALRALLESAIGAARDMGARRLAAFPQEHEHCPIRSYMAGWCGLSDRLPAVARTLSTAGFSPFYRELHLSMSPDRFSPPSVPVYVTPPPPDVELRPGRDKYQRPVLRALDGQTQIGVCAYARVGAWGSATDHPDAARCGFIWWLHTDPAHRRRGIARALLTHALATLANQGCTECWITTGADNWPAQPLYLSLGFEIVDSSACYARDL